MSLFDLDNWQEVGDGLRANPVRTLLTMAGVFWGTFMLVAALGFTSGLEQATLRTMRGTVTNAVFVWGGRTSLPYRGRQPGRRIHFSNRDIPDLEAIEGVRFLSPRQQFGGYRDGTPVFHGEEAGAFEVMGDVPNYRQITTVEWDEGRFVNDLDIAARRKVAVIGREVHRTLWPDGSSPIGDWIRIRGAHFRVVGLFHSSLPDDRGDRDDNTIHIPLSTFQQAFNSGDRIRWFAFLVDADHSGAELEVAVKQTLAERHMVHPEDIDSMGSYNAEREFRRIQGLFLGTRGITWLVGLATLLSGAVGVSNVLLIVVRERTQEIGVRRALGATPSSIVAMILQESLVMTALAGMAGLLIGIGLVEIGAMLVGPDNPSFGVPRVDPIAAGVAAVLLVAVGGVAGVLPARRAVAIEPVDALRAE